MRISFATCCALLIATSESKPKRYVHVLEGPFLSDDALNATSSDTRISFSEVPSSSTGDWSGHKVWPSAAALLQHLHGLLGDKLRGLNVLELGCGLPFATSGFAALGALVCCTDLREALPFIESALSTNDTSGLSMKGLTTDAHRRVRVRELSWGAEEVARGLSEYCGFKANVDLVVGADLVYDGNSWAPLEKTLMAILREHGATGVLALQPRGFPLVSSLKQQGQVAGFVRSLSSQAGWHVQAERAGSQEGPLIITVTPAGAHARAVPAVGDAAGRPGWRPLRYFKVPVQAQDERTTSVQQSEL